MILGASDLALLRERPHLTHLYLSIYKPITVMSAQVNNASIAKGAITIAYNNATGSYTNVKASMTMLVGTSVGDGSIGKVRIRSVDGSAFVVAENSDIAWADDLWLTVLNYVDVWPIYPRIIQDPADAENVIFYKDYDVAYSDQNDVLGSFPCAGPHRAGFKNSNIYYSSSGTYNVNGDALTYLWSFEGGTPTGSTSATPGNVLYDTPGHYRTTLVVSNASGGSDTTHRFVSIYDRPEEGPNVPILQWEMTQLEGSRAGGGYTASMKVYQQIDDIQDNALVVIFADDVYGTTSKSLGGNAENNSNIVFVGYILKGSIHYNYRSTAVEFDVGSINEVMKTEEGFSISCESKVTPTTWFEIKNLSVDKALYHYLRWHSTVLNVCDFQYTGDARAHQYLDTDRQSLYDAIDNFIRSGVVGEIVSDRQGKLWAEISASGVHDAKTALPTTLNIDKRDWMNEPTITELQAKEVSYMEVGGIYYAGPISGAFTALLCDVPGITPSCKGRSERLEGLILTGQSQLNDLAGDIFAYKNAKYTVSMLLSGNYRNLDIAPLEQCLLNVEQLDTARGVVFAGEHFHPVEMFWTYDSAKGTFNPSITFNQVTEGVVGETVVIPDEPPDDGGEIPSPTIPPIYPITHVYQSYTWDIIDPSEWEHTGTYLYRMRSVVLIACVIKGSGSASFNVYFGTDPNSAGTAIMFTDAVVTSTPTLNLNMKSGVIPAGNYLWPNITDITGEVTEISITVVTQSF